MINFFIVLDYFKKGLLRTIVGVIFLGIYILFILAFNPPELSPAEFFQSFISWKWFWVLFGFGFGSIVFDLANEYGPDKFSIKIDRWIGKQKWGKFSSYFGKMYMERATRSSFFLRVDDLDELIHRVYNNATGEIYLFNPSEDLIDLNNPKWDDIRLSIRNNKNNIKMIFVIANKNHFDSDINVANKLSLPPKQVELKIITDEELLILSNNLRMAIYHTTIGKNKKIEYFMYRPINKPYNDKFVLIQDYDSLDTLLIPNGNDERLHSAVNELIKKF